MSELIFFYRGESFGEELFLVAYIDIYRERGDVIFLLLGVTILFLQWI